MTAQSEDIARAIGQRVEQGPSLGVDTVHDPEEVIIFAGRPFKVAEKFGLMPLIKLGYLSKKGLDTADEDALAAMYDVIRQAIHADDWDAFCDHAADVHADEDELMACVQQAVQVISGRPTRRPSDSSDGPSPTGTSSSGALSSPASLTPRQAQAREHLRLLLPVEEALATEGLRSGTG
jgi:hypothetical protein